MQGFYWVIPRVLAGTSRPGGRYSADRSLTQLEIDLGWLARPGDRSAGHAHRRSPGRVEHRAARARNASSARRRHDPAVNGSVARRAGLHRSPGGGRHTGRRPLPGRSGAHGYRARRLPHPRRLTPYSGYRRTPIGLPSCSREPAPGTGSGGVRRAPGLARYPSSPIHAGFLLGGVRRFARPCVCHPGALAGRSDSLGTKVFSI